MSWINNLLDDYFTFLKDKTIITNNDSTDWIEISTPFLGFFNDTIDIYVKQIDNKILLSDDGNTIRNLGLQGVDISRSPKRKKILESILLNYGIRLINNELETEATAKEFPQKKLNLISTISEITDLYHLAKATVTSVFNEDVKEYLDAHEIIYTPHFISKGNSGLEFAFDFQIAYRQKEIMLKSFNTINKLNLPHFLFTWEDIKKVRQRQTDKDIVGLAIINDSNIQISDEYLNALHNYGANYILWSEKEDDKSTKLLQAA